MKIGIITMEQADNRPINSVGSSRIRGRWLWKYWDEAEEYMIGEKYDGIIFQKVYWKEMLEQFEGIKILDICDPDYLEGKPVMEYINMCDACVTSTEPLAEYIRKFTNVPVVCIPDRLDLSEFTIQREKHIGKPARAFWFGYSQNDHYINRTIPFLKRHNIQLVVFSNQMYQPPGGYGKVDYKWIEYDQSKLLQEMVKCDIALLPDPSTVDIRGKYKSNNKDQVAWACGVPVVKQPEDLERFIDPLEREKEAKEKLRLVRSEYDVKISVQEYKELVHEILRRDKENSTVKKG